MILQILARISFRIGRNSGFLRTKSQPMERPPPQKAPEHARIPSEDPARSPGNRLSDGRTAETRRSCTIDRPAARTMPETKHSSATNARRPDYAGNEHDSATNARRPEARLHRVRPKRIRPKRIRPKRIRPKRVRPKRIRPKRVRPKRKKRGAPRNPSLSNRTVTGYRALYSTFEYFSTSTM